MVNTSLLHLKSEAVPVSHSLSLSANRPREMTMFIAGSLRVAANLLDDDAGIALARALAANTTLRELM